MPPRVTAAEAMTEAKEARAALESHEAICAERYSRIFETLAELKGLAKWAAGGVFGIIVALLGWSGVQLYSVNNARLEALEAPAVVQAGDR